MRPILLKMSAFGPYAGETVIPMNELGDQGLYLITGDTGAGKTTIFDAICYALFGEPSGNNREANMFRSKYADPDMETVVELTFVHANKEYKVTRNPEYMRPAKRGDGMKKQTADAQLIMPNGQVVTKVKDVTATIENLLGINRDQFSQIAMLAQGDFLKLLLADTKQRQEIFRELFKTGYYQRLQIELENKRKAVYGQVEDGKKSVNQYVSGICVDEDDVLEIEVNKAKSEQMTTEDIIELLGTLTAQDRQKKETLESELNLIVKELGEVNAQIGVAETIAKARTALAEAEQALEESIPMEAELKAKLESARNELAQKDQLTTQAAEIGAQLADYDTVESLRVQIEETETNQKSVAEALASAEESINEKDELIRALKKEQSEYKDVSAAIANLNNDLQKILSDIEGLEELAEEYQQYVNEQEGLKQAQEEYVKLDLDCKEKIHMYEAMDQTYRDGQAYVLAAKLKDGDKCPVCGSTTHPDKACKSAEVPTEAQLKKAKEQAEQARTLATNSANDVGGRVNAVRILGEELCKKAKKSLESDDLDSMENSIIKTQSVLSKKASEIRQNIETETNKEKRKAEVDKLIPNLEEEIESLRDAVIGHRETIAGAQSKIQQNTRQIQDLSAKLRYQSKTEAVKQQDELTIAANALQEAYDKADREAKQKSEEIVALKSRIEENRKTIDETKDVDLDAANHKKSRLVDEQNSNIDATQIIAARINTNETIKTNIEKVSLKIADIEKQLQWISALADTANGKLRGKEKIMLETYIQTTYFDRIIRRANIRLMTMSSGQYQLKRQDEATNAKSQSGLELAVIDHYNGTERSIKTLSGGESFIASLSLALGLSDEVQSSAGGIQIDTMFVDEGFGSLDPETLDMAYRALSSLTDGNKLVGIISHVAYLKEKIDRQIVVTKQKSGGSFVRIQ